LDDPIAVDEELPRRRSARQEKPPVLVTTQLPMGTLESPASGLGGGVAGLHPDSRPSKNVKPSHFIGASYHDAEAHLAVKKCTGWRHFAIASRSQACSLITLRCD